jgi:hypothetical protein
MADDGEDDDVGENANLDQRVFIERARTDVDVPGRALRTLDFFSHRGNQPPATFLFTRPHITSTTTATATHQQAQATRVRTIVLHKSKHVAFSRTLHLTSMKPSRCTEFQDCERFSTFKRPLFPYDGRRPLLCSLFSFWFD